MMLILAVGDPVDPEMEPDTAQQNSQEAADKQEEEEEEDEADPAVLAKKQKQLAKRGVTFEAKVDPKVPEKGTPNAFCLLFVSKFDGMVVP